MGKKVDAVPKELSEMSLEELWQLFPIQLTEHNNNWDNWFRDENERLKSVLSEASDVKIYHIGSTAIRAIWAKPIVDILIEVSSMSKLKVVKKLLSEAGYLCMNETDTRMTFNKGYTKYGFAERVFHIHVRLYGDHDELYFRDFMNEKPELAKEYEKLKLSLWKQYEHDREGYTNAKTELVKEYTKQAKAFYGDKEF